MAEASINTDSFSSSRGSFVGVGEFRTQNPRLFCQANRDIDMIMSLLLEAKTPEELLMKLRGEPRFDRPREAEEWSQLRFGLKCAAHSGLVAYPLSVFRDADQVPDFTLRLADQSAGVELTTITTNQLEKSRVDQVALLQEGIQLGAGRVTSLMLDDRKRTRGERIKERLIASPNELPPTRAAVDDSWLNNVCGRVEKKTESMKQPWYRHADQRWLLLWDRLSRSSTELDGRLQLLRDRLDSYWRLKRRFHRILIQPRDFDALFILSADVCGKVIVEDEIAV